MTFSHQYNNWFANAFILAAMFGWGNNRPVPRTALPLRMPAPAAPAEEKKPAPRLRTAQRAARPEPALPVQYRLPRLPLPRRGARLDEPRPQVN